MGLPWNHVAPLPLHTPGLWNTMIHDGFWILILSNAFHFADPGSPDHTFDTVCFLQSCDRHSWGKPNPLGAWGAHRGPCWSGASLEAQQHPTPLGWAWEHHSGGTWCSSGTIWWFLLFCRLLIIISNGAPPKWGKHTTIQYPGTFLNSHSHGYRRLPSLPRQGTWYCGQTEGHHMPCNSSLRAWYWSFCLAQGDFARGGFFQAWHLHKSNQSQKEKCWDVIKESFNKSHVCKCPHVPASSKLAHLILHDWPSLGVHTSNVTYLQLPEYFS